ncbi:hypothetical protein [Bradyrhizobium sp. STM 3557]|uniref:hypothetical protein n=1 Tax=Bradyrhizobium sp. STM 3557 TaxID=578920 RepID=UPI00388EE299
MFDEPRRELDLWAARGLKASFWMRDDDAVEVSDSLVLLREIAARYAVKIGLAVIPGQAVPELTSFLETNARHFYPMCHGWQHINYNTRHKPAEFGAERPHPKLVHDAELALGSFSAAFRHVKPIFVPPFNRITPALIRALPRVGFFGVSLMPTLLEQKLARLGSKINVALPVPLPDLRSSNRIDVHIDLINWQTRSAQDYRLLAQQLVRELRYRRLGYLRTDSPIGLLTHHLAHNLSIWRACDDVLGFLRSHPAVQFLDLDQWTRAPSQELELRSQAPAID